MSSKERSIQVYVSGFSRRTTRDDIKDKFKTYGKIHDIKLKNGFAFIEFEHTDDALEAIEDGTKKELEIDGRKLVIEQAGRDRKRRSGTNGPQPEDECYNCGKKGHWRNECKEPPRRRFRHSSPSSESDSRRHSTHKSKHRHRKYSSSSSRSSSKSDRSSSAS